MVSSWTAIHYRHRKNQEAVQQLLGRLRDNREQQHFLQDCQEVRLSSLVPLWHFLAIHPLHAEKTFMASSGVFCISWTVCPTTSSL